MSEKAILDSRLWVRLDLDISLKANSLFHTNPVHRAHLAAQLLLYDTIIIPTKDFGIVPILIAWMGLPTFQEALECGALSFLRPKVLFGYAPNGHGIQCFEISETPEKIFNWWQTATFGSMEEAANLQLAYQCPFLTRTQRQHLVTRILAQSRSFEPENEQFRQHVVHESYTDVMGSPVLSAFMLAHEPPGTTVRLPRLSGIDANQFRILSLEKIRDGIDLVLRVAEINFEIMMGHAYTQADLGTSVGAEELLRGKLARAGATQQLLDKFQSLLELENMRDVRPAVVSGEVSFEDIWKIRQRTDAKRFRQWLHGVQPADARELEKAYVAALGRSSVYNSLPVRGLRFILTTALGAIVPFSDMVIGAADSFFVEKWLEGYSPKLFLEQLRRLPGVGGPEDGA